MYLGDEGAVVLGLAGPDHGADGVHHAHAVLLQVGVSLHVAEVLRLRPRVRGEQAARKQLILALLMNVNSKS